MNLRLRAKHVNFIYLILCLKAMLLPITGVCRALLHDEPSKGIHFYIGSWKELLAESRIQGKPIFVDMYTTWCGPCKLMAKEAFSNLEVGKVFNEKFISYQVDAEKGEGIEIAKQYAVDAFPTSLYVSSDGALIHRVSGYSGIENMLSEADKAIKKSGTSNSLASLDKQYKEGNRNAEFLATYLSELTVQKKSNGEALDIYLSLIPTEQWSSKSNIELITNNTVDLDSKAFSFLMKQVPILIKSEERQTRDLGLAARMQQFHVVNRTLERAISTKNETLLEKCIDYELNIYGTMATSKVNPVDFSIGQRLYFYQQTKQMPKYKPLALVEANRLMALSVDSVRAIDSGALKQFIAEKAGVSDSIKIRKSYKMQIERLKSLESNKIARKLNELSKTFYENITDTTDLNKALIWSMRSLDYVRNGSYLETAAILLRQLDRRKEAVTLIEEAINFEKRSGKDALKLEKFLQELLN